MRRSIVFSLFALILALPQPAVAQNSVADFYRGKTITLMVGYSAGGGYDTYARILARHIGQAHPRQSLHRRAEAARRGLHACRQLCSTTWRRRTAPRSACSAAASRWSR